MAAQQQALEQANRALDIERQSGTARIALKAALDYKAIDRDAALRLVEKARTSGVSHITQQAVAALDAKSDEAVAAFGLPPSNLDHTFDVVVNEDHCALYAQFMMITEACWIRRCSAKTITMFWEALNSLGLPISKVEDLLSREYAFCEVLDALSTWRGNTRQAGRIPTPDEFFELVKEGKTDLEVETHEDVEIVWGLGDRQELAERIETYEQTKQQTYQSTGVVSACESRAKALIAKFRKLAPAVRKMELYEGADGAECRSLDESLVVLTDQSQATAVDQFLERSNDGSGECPGLYYPLSPKGIWSALVLAKLSAAVASLISDGERV